MSDGDKRNGKGQSKAECEVKGKVGSCSLKQSGRAIPKLREERGNHWHLWGRASRQREPQV